ncbi:hypothetical protein SAMN02745121_03901 [Nannocystis exedens]|uniref:Uncharacterized protein n=1 Tax=Nannocystis exedens TaxID=54 RepID=A0A1I1ZQ95_9BACT|nr:hypothetical protein [Nannocystis exedens]PCC75372.1 hypothetical protein NAEX_08482 [Nannocystis exedens]SFE33841.1 hypothetical protein SAMN02745121_03901 [Nannocystis exedens]
MGYDLQMVRTPEAADETELPNSHGIAGYYRFNLWGMRMTVGALEWADAIHDGPAPEIPDLELNGLDEDRVFTAIEALRGDAPADAPTPTQAELAAARAYVQAHEAAVSASSLQDGRVGAFKFQTNDGWLVTPEECAALARKLRQHAEVIARDYFPDADVSREDGLKWMLGFARYNEIAAEHGGYRVR